MGKLPAYGGSTDRELLKFVLNRIGGECVRAGRESQEVIDRAVVVWYPWCIS